MTNLDKIIQFTENTSMKIVMLGTLGGTVIGFILGILLIVSKLG